MKFYHRTKEYAWKAIQEEGVLWGVHDSCRYTYLAPNVFDESYGDVVLEVDYTPTREGRKHGQLVGYMFEPMPKHNYGFDPPPGQYCGQFSVFEPIPLSQVKRVDPKEATERLKNKNAWELQYWPANNPES